MLKRKIRDKKQLKPQQNETEETELRIKIALFF